MEQWLNWIATTLVTLALGALAWFFKRLVVGLEKKIDDQPTQLTKKIDDQQAQLIKKIDDQQAQLTKTIDDQQRHNNELFDKAEKRVLALEDRVNGAIREMPFVYTLREDFLRSQATTDRKLDRILEKLEERGGRNCGN